MIEHETAPDADTKDRLCEEARAQLSAARADPNLRFLVARCVEAPEQQMQAVLEAYAEQPDHGWSALAAGFIFARSGQLSEADEALRKVKRRLSFMAPTLAAELERARGATK
ncbi:MAG TPA: hypothetical protein VJV78_49510 [Polyangiales bacterium]|nr:hypothetical protein [Polyangiales bacterium]